MNLNPQELAKVRKLADVSIALKNEMKQGVTEEKLRTLNATIKKLLMKKDTTIEIFVVRETQPASMNKYTKFSTPPALTVKNLRLNQQCTKNRRIITEIAVPRFLRFDLFR